jgi:hypothetical protein
MAAVAELGSLGFMRTLLLISIAVILAGCVSRPQQESGVIRLDNRGGFSHAGRRVALLSDGSYRDTRYTDVVRDERTTAGHYTFDAEERHLTLSPERGEVQHLYRVDYGGQQYWVRTDERARITQSSESWLRQISLRVVP